MQVVQRELVQVRPERERLVYQVEELSVARRDLQAKQDSLQ